MVIINTVSDKYFNLNGVNYAKIYQPLKQGNENIGIYNVYDTKQQLLDSTKYDQYLIDGVVYASQSDAVAALIPVIYLENAVFEVTNSITQNITNNPDEEDITEEGGLLKFKDRDSTTNTKGYKIIRSDFDWSSLDSSYNDCILEIRYDFDLTGVSVVMPYGAKLLFNGGVLRNYTSIDLNGVEIESGKTACFLDGGQVVGSIKNDKIYPEWFGANGDGVNDDSDALIKALSFKGKNIVVSEEYYITRTLNIASEIRMTGGGGRKNSVLGRIISDQDITMLKFESTDTNVVVGDKSGLVMENIVVGGMSGARPSVLLYLNVVRNCIFNNCYFSGGRVGVKLKQVYDSEFYSTYFINMDADNGVEACGVLLESSAIGNTNQINFFGCAFESIKCKYDVSNNIVGQAYAVKSVGASSPSQSRNNKCKFFACHFEPNDINTFCFHTYFSYNFFIGGGCNFIIENFGVAQVNHPFYFEQPYNLFIDNIQVEHGGFTPLKEPFNFKTASVANVNMTNVAFFGASIPNLKVYKGEGLFASPDLYAAISCLNISFNGAMIPSYASQFGEFFAPRIQSVDKGVNIFKVNNVDPSTNAVREFVIRKENGLISIQSYNDVGGFSGELLKLDVSTNNPTMINYGQFRQTDGILRLGNYWIFPDSSGRLRIHTSYPVNVDTDGTIIGTQS